MTIDGGTGASRRVAWLAVLVGMVGVLSVPTAAPAGTGGRAAEGTGALAEAARGFVLEHGTAEAWAGATAPPAGATARLGSTMHAAGTRSTSTRTVAEVDPICYEQNINDANDIALLDIGAASIAYDCPADVWLAGVATYDSWVDSALDAYFWDFNADRNLTTGCYGIDFFAVALYDDANGLIAGVLKTPSCNSAQWSDRGGAGVTRGGFTDFIAVAITPAQVGSPASFSWLQELFAVGQSNWDIAPGTTGNLTTLPLPFKVAVGPNDAIRYGGPTGLGATPTRLNIKTDYDSWVPGDFNGDGMGDVLFAQWGSGADAIRYGTPTGLSDPTTVSVTGTFSRGVPGDFNDDGIGDVLFVKWGTGADAIRFGTPTGLSVATFVDIDGTYDAALPGDFNGDGLDDVLFAGFGTDRDVIRRGTGAGLGPPIDVTITGTYSRSAPGDFNGDGRGDALFARWGTGLDALRYGTAGGLAPALGVSITGTYDTIVPGDFNGNGRGDALLLKWGTGADALRYGLVTGLATAVAVNVSGTYTAGIPGDFDGDGYGDVLLYRSA